MSLSLGRRKSSQQQQSAPLTPDEVAGYFGKIDELTGGRLGGYAREGTAPIDYESPTYEGATPEQIRALGGAGATRELKANQARARAIEEIGADPSFSVAQKQRARQLTDADYGDRLDAIAKETEATLAGTAIDESGRRYQAGADEARRRYEAQLRNAGLRAEDIERIAGIFFGGKGTQSSGGSTARGFDFGFGIKS